jgi:hypothetical protein
MITLEQAKGLSYGTTLYHALHRNADGSPQRWRVSGKVKTWVRSPHRVEIPVKHGLYDFDRLTESELHLICLDEEEALNED